MAEWYALWSACMLGGVVAGSNLAKFNISYILIHIDCLDNWSKYHYKNNDMFLGYFVTMIFFEVSPIVDQSFVLATIEI